MPDAPVHLADAPAHELASLFASREASPVEACRAVLQRIRAYAAGSPFVISSVVVGNVQYPEEVASAVSRKLAATQELQRKDTEIEIERKERTKREVQAQGIANAMQIIRGQLSTMYIQHEAIEAQKQMVNSQNHTVVYIPVGPMGVPITGTFDVAAK